MLTLYFINKRNGRFFVPSFLLTPYNVHFRKIFFTFPCITLLIELSPNSRRSTNAIFPLCLYKSILSDLQFKIKDYEKNELLHIKEIEQLKKEAHKNSVTIEKLNTEKYKEHETIQAQLSEKTKLLSEQEKELNVLHIQLAEQSKESELIKERAVIEKEREMLSKIEELRNALDEAKEEKYNLRLQLTKLQK